jgi:Type IV pili methyl-accepting chemotaxis transducer N-term
MAINRRSWVIGASACGLMPFVFAQIGNLGQAVNLSGRQRMLAMRTVKAYLTLGREIEPERSAKLLQASVADYDRALTQLRVYAPTPEIKDSFLKLSDKWRDAKDVLIGLAPSKSGAKNALEGAEELVSMADLATRQLEKLSGAAAAIKLVNVSGRQRLLTQRIAAYHFARDWALSDAQSRAQVARARGEHETALRALEASEANTVDIKRQLVGVKNMWVFFDVAIATAPSNAGKAASDLVSASELILQGYDDLTGLYAKLS